MWFGVIAILKNQRTKQPKRTEKQRKHTDSVKSKEFYSDSLDTA